MTTHAIKHVRNTKIFHSTFVTVKRHVSAHLMKSVGTFDEKCRHIEKSLFV